MHLLSSDKISFSMAIWRKCLEHSVVFPGNLFEATCISCFCCYPSVEIPGCEVFSHPSWALKHFLEGFKVFCVVLMKDKSSHIKK